MDLLEDTGPANTPEFTVSDLSGAVKRMIEGEFSHVRVRGEVGRVSRPSSGHLYLDLKDDRAVLAGVIWKGQAGRLTVRPEEGMEVVATGRLTTFPGQSKYQMVIDDLAPAGAGALMAMLEKRRAQLAAEGLFDPARKKPIPFLPEVIGVITSPSGAVIRDILHRLRDRFPRRVILWPVAVQGAACAPEVARAIAGFNALQPGGRVPRPDLLIVARGGGSVEDLWGFNEEIVVRAAAASRIPLISAVGHETDTTLIDFAADLRAPTPTAAAELAVPVRLDLMATVESLGARGRQATRGALALRRQRVADLGRGLPRPEALLAIPAQRLDGLALRLPLALTRRIETGRLRLARAALSPQVLRGLMVQRGGALAAAGARLPVALGQRLNAGRLRLARASLTPGPLVARLAAQAARLQALEPRLAPAVARGLGTRADRLGALGRLLASLGHRATLARGYAIVHGPQGLVTSAAAAAALPGVEVEFADGRLALRPEGPASRKARARPGPAEDQGSLL